MKKILEKRCFSKEQDEQMAARQRENFFSEEGKAKHKKNIKKLFAISLLVAILFSLLNWGVVSNWGNVKISRLTLAGSNSDKISALLYVPDNATADNPAPCVICYHGNAGNARNHESWATELARRGFVVVTPDMYGAGNSDNSASELIDYESMFVNGFSVYDHVLTWDFVDSDNIMTAGHSMGGTTAYAVASQYDAKGILIASNRIASHISKKEGENYQQLYEQILGYTGNVIMVYGDVEKGIDEAAMLDLAYTWITAKVERGYEPYTGMAYTKLDEVVGSFEEGNAVVASIDTNRVHEAAFVSQETIGKLVEFAQKSVDKVPNYIESSNQVWMYKDYLGLAGTLTFCVVICALALLLIEVIPFFEEVKRAPTRNLGLRKVGMVISLALGVIFPFIILKTNAFGLGDFFLPDSSTSPPDFIQGRAPFHMTYANLSMATVICLTILGCLGFALYFFTDGKKVKLTANDLGLTASDSDKFSFKLIGKTLFLAVIVVAVAWGFLALQEEVLGTTFYSWFFGFKALPLNTVKYYPPYIIVWSLCFIISSFTINVERRLPTTGNETLDTVAQMIVNIFFATITMIIIISIDWYFESYGVKGFTFINSYKIDVAKMWGMPVGMSVGVGGSTLLYRHTRNTWLSAFLMGTVAALMCVTYGLVRIYS